MLKFMTLQRLLDMKMNKYVYVTVKVAVFDTPTIVTCFI